MQEKLQPREKPLTDYHQKMNEAGLKQVAEWAKHPLSFKEAKANVDRVNEEVSKRDSDNGCQSGVI
jgi:hypothetical protein